jgi:hypothetical protein
LRTYGAAPGRPATAKINAYLDDYAFFIHGLLCLHDASGEPNWLKYAENLTDAMVKYHQDNDRSGFFYTSNDHEKLFARAKDQYDGAQPSGNSVAARNLVRLWVKTGNNRYRDIAEKTIKTFSANLKANPTSLATMAEALALFLDARDREKRQSPPTPDPKLEFGNEGGVKENKTKKSDAVVKIEASATKSDSDNKQILTITIAIDKPWHLYANPVPTDFPGIPTSVTIETQGKTLDAKVEYPRGKLVKDATLGDYFVYEDKVKIQAIVPRAKDDISPLQAIVKFQACSEKHCLLASTVTVKIP